MPAGSMHKKVNMKIFNLGLILIIFSGRLNLLSLLPGYLFGTFVLNLDLDVKSSPFQELLWPFSKIWNWYASRMNHIEWGTPLIGQNTKRGKGHGLIIGTGYLLTIFFFIHLDIDFLLALLSGLITNFTLTEIMTRFFQKWLNILGNEIALLNVVGLWLANVIHALTDMLEDRTQTEVKKPTNGKVKKKFSIKSVFMHRKN